MILFFPKYEYLPVQLTFEVNFSAQAFHELLCLQARLLNFNRNRITWCFCLGSLYTYRFYLFGCRNPRTLDKENRIYEWQTNKCTCENAIMELLKIYHLWTEGVVNRA